MKGGSDGVLEGVQYFNCENGYGVFFPLSALEREESKEKEAATDVESDRATAQSPRGSTTSSNLLLSKEEAEPSCKQLRYGQHI